MLGGLGKIICSLVCEWKMYFNCKVSSSLINLTANEQPFVGQDVVVRHTPD